MRVNFDQNDTKMEVFHYFFYEKKKDANIVHNIGLGYANNIDASHTVQFGILLFHLLTNSVI